MLHVSVTFDDIASPIADLTVSSDQGGSSVAANEILNDTVSIRFGTRYAYVVSSLKKLNQLSLAATTIALKFLGSFARIQYPSARARQS